MYVDTDIALWKRPLSEIPQGWINGRESKDFLEGSAILLFRLL